jgi:hypothetical protein
MTDFTTEAAAMLRAFRQYLLHGIMSDTPVEMDFDEALTKLTTAHERDITRTKKAYGNCTNCFGKGYSTVNGRWSGYDTDTATLALLEERSAAVIQLK